MRVYEFTLIFEPSLTEKDQKELLGKIKKLIASQKGKIEKETSWGKRCLAYPILKKQEGIYHFLIVKIKPSGWQEVEKKLKLEEKILRYLIIKSN